MTIKPAKPGKPGTATSRRKLVPTGVCMNHQGGKKCGRPSVLRIAKIDLCAECVELVREIEAEAKVSAAAKRATGRLDENGVPVPVAVPA